MSGQPLTEQEVHAQNLRDLKLIREDPAWALSRVQEARRLKQRLAESERELDALREAGRDAHDRLCAIYELAGEDRFFELLRSDPPEEPA